MSLMSENFVYKLKKKYVTVDNKVSTLFKISL